jgi:hypothetical protein
VNISPHKEERKVVWTNSVGKGDNYIGSMLLSGVEFSEIHWYDDRYISINLFFLSCIGNMIIAIEI